MGQLRPSAIVGQISGKTQTAAFRRGKGGRMYVNNYVKRTSKTAGVANTQKRWMVCVALLVQWWADLAKFGNIATAFGSAINGLTKAIYPGYAAAESTLPWGSTSTMADAKASISSNLDNMNSGQTSTFTNIVFKLLSKVSGTWVAKGTNLGSIASKTMSGEGELNVEISLLDEVVHKVEVMAIDVNSGKLMSVTDNAYTSGDDITVTGFTAVTATGMNGLTGKYAAYFLVKLDGKPLNMTLADAYVVSA